MTGRRGNPRQGSEKKTKRGEWRRGEDEREEGVNERRHFGVLRGREREIWEVRER
jgi:hypothetical protein